MTHILAEMFRWPDGIVLGNLIASAIWATPALLHLHAKINRNHRELKGNPPCALCTTRSMPA